MITSSYRTSRPDAWSVPRATSDPSLRLQTYGPIRPMEEPGMLQRWLRLLHR